MKFAQWIQTWNNVCSYGSSSPLQEVDTAVLISVSYLLHFENTFYLGGMNLQEGRSFEMAKTSFPVEEGTDGICGPEEN